MRHTPSRLRWSTKSSLPRPSNGGWSAPRSTIWCSSQYSCATSTENLDPAARRRRASWHLGLPGHLVQDAQRGCDHRAAKGVDTAAILWPADRRGGPQGRGASDETTRGEQDEERPSYWKSSLLSLGRSAPS